MNRKELIKSAKCIVIKIGTYVLTSDTGLNRTRISNIAEEIVELRKQNIKIIIVSSGAIGAGMKALGIRKHSLTISKKQAVAAVGQNELMHTYKEIFKKRGYHTAQILLTRDDFKSRLRYLNIRNTIMELFKENVIPIVNENDTVATEEIKFGDNDTLSALVANLLDADLLIMLSNIDGLFTVDPQKSKQAFLISEVDKIRSKIESYASDSKTGVGGMLTKITAAKMGTQSGVTVIIANGLKKNIVSRIMNGEKVGTIFLPKIDKRKTGRKKWIAFAHYIRGTIIVDKGAKQVLINKGKSLLSTGIIASKGKYNIGDVVGIADAGGKEFARGLVNYSDKDVEKIKGNKTSQIEDILGYKSYDEVVHRDNLVIL
ncbi:glutamate 5-kinase [bacterium]|nr:glutamate 5-kinase [bacterium]